jgi:tetratricopeptide (TPR) repeat protein
MISARAQGTDEPYPGGRPFGKNDHERFFGREKESATLADLWRERRLTIATGPAGIGKTSLLHAGVLPLITGGPETVLPPGRLSYGATFPWAALPDENPYTIALLSSWSPATTPTRLAGMTIAEFVSRDVRRTGHRDTPVLGVIDHVEELLGDSGPRHGHRQRFLASIRMALLEQRQLHLLLIVRDEASQLLRESVGEGAYYRLGPLSRSAAVSAVTAPLKKTGRVFAPGAADQMLTDLQSKSASGSSEGDVASVYFQPALLQIVCTQLWSELPSGLSVITPANVRQYGDADTALAAWCGRVIAATASEHGLLPAHLHQWLLRTFLTEDGRCTDAYEGPGATAGMTNAVVGTLEDRHLLRALQRIGQRWYGLMSDRLIRPLCSAVIDPPTNSPPATYLGAAERALSLSDLASAEQYAQLALQASAPAGVRLQAEASSLLGNVAYEREKDEDATSWYRKAAEGFAATGDNSAVAYQLAAAGQALLRLGKLSQARDQLIKAADRSPDDPILQAGLARALWGLGNARTAVAILNPSLSLDPGNQEALATRGEILADLGDGRAALRDLDRVRPKERPAIQAARGLALTLTGDLDAGRREIETALIFAPRNGSVLLYAARAARSTDPLAAAELARRAVEAVDPELSLYHREKARAMYKAD